MEYRVTWAIDVTADSHKDAAKKAQEMQRDLESTATVFDVQDTGNNGVLKQVDLTDGNVIEMSPPKVIVEVSGGVAGVTGRDLPKGTMFVILDYDAQGFDKTINVNHQGEQKTEEALSNGFDMVDETDVDLVGLDKALAAMESQ